MQELPYHENIPRNEGHNQRASLRMRSFPTHRHRLYDIAMAIGNSLEIDRMLKESLGAYLAAFGCTSAAVYRATTPRRGGFEFELLYAVPPGEHLHPSPADFLPDEILQGTKKRMFMALPVVQQCRENRFVHLFALPDFGLLMLQRIENPFSEPEIRSLEALNGKLSRSCTACFQNRKLEKINSRLQQEIAERKRAEKAIRAGEMRYRNIFDTAAVSIWEQDLSGVATLVRSLQRGGVKNVREHLHQHPELVRRMAGSISVRDVNAATLKLYRAKNKSELLGALDKIVTPKSLEVLLELVVAVAESRRYFECELINRTLDGEEIHVLMNLIVPREIREFDSVLLSIMDISERKRLEAQFLYAQKMEAIGTLAGGIAHDFNNLLMSIEGNTSLMLHDLVEEHPHVSTLKSIEKQVRSGAKLTAQLLGYARKGRYELKPVSVNRIVRETAEAFGRTCRRISLQFDLHDELKSVEADRGQIEQTLLNLYVNAADAMPEGGQLKISSANVTHQELKGKPYRVPAGDYVNLNVTDTGCGMDATIRERIFEPFFTTKEMGRGTGLGLASVYGIIKGHGGFIDVASCPQEGTTFRIYLPASTRQIDTELQPSAGTVSIGRNRTVLLVDDEQVVLEVGMKMLEKIGCTTVAACNGDEAVRVYKEMADRIDLVVLDMIMPDMSGGAAYDALKEVNPEVRVLLSSGYSLNGEASEILKRGCNGFIQKPFSIQELSVKIAHILHQDQTG